MKESAAALNLALLVEQPVAAVAAVALRAKLNGLLVDRKEIGGPGAFVDLSDDEIWARLAARLQHLGLPVSAKVLDAAAIGDTAPAPEPEAEKGSAQCGT